MTTKSNIPPQVPTEPDELREWIREHDIYEVECIVPDQAGVTKGKVMPAKKFVEFSPLFLPVTIFLQTIPAATRRRTRRG